MTSGERSYQPRGHWRWRNGTTPVIGLTGGVASGKSAVAALLAERGCAAIDADRVGHEVLDRSDVQKKLVDRFGPSVVLEPGPVTATGPRAPIGVPSPPSFSPIKRLGVPLRRSFIRSCGRDLSRQ